MTKEIFMDRPDASHLNDAKTFNSLEAPLILGVAVVGLLVGCALYHMCYRRLCFSNRNSRMFYSRNRGPSTAEIRSRRTMFSEMFRQPNGEDDRLGHSHPSSNSLPDYNELQPPCYSNATKMLPLPKKAYDESLRLSMISASSEEPPPSYEDCKEEDEEHETYAETV